LFSLENSGFCGIVLIHTFFVIKINIEEIFPGNCLTNNKSGVCIAFLDGFVEAIVAPL